MLASGASRGRRAHASVANARAEGARRLWPNNDFNLGEIALAGIIASARFEYATVSCRPVLGTRSSVRQGGRRRRSELGGEGS